MLNEIIKAPNTKMPRKKSIIGTVLICLVLWFVLGIINDTLGTFVFLASIFIIGGTKQFNNEEYQKRLAKYHEEMEEYQKKFSVLEKNKNIIPVQYRNLGSIAYLYEYFSTSQATNLDQVIQTMLLDDVRQRIQNIENQLIKPDALESAAHLRKIIRYTAHSVLYLQTVGRYRTYFAGTD